MRCPYCQHDDSKVIDSRAVRGGEAIRRRRQCLRCHKRYTTYERLEEFFPQIIKRDGSREAYERSKVMHGLRLACVKRPIPTEALDAAIDALEEQLLALGQREVDSSWLGERLTLQLRELDPIAYIRFASVYKAFDNLQEFLEELERFEAIREGASDDG